MATVCIAARPADDAPPETVGYSRFTPSVRAGVEAVTGVEDLDDIGSHL